MLDYIWRFPIKANIFVVNFILFVFNKLIVFISTHFVNVLLFHSSDILTAITIVCILIVSSFSLFLFLYFIAIDALFITVRLFSMIMFSMKLSGLIIIVTGVLFCLTIGVVIYSGSRLTQLII